MNSNNYYNNMKDLKQYIEEECGAGGFSPGMATPANTMGMGNPTPPGIGDPNAIGSEGLPTAKAKVEKPKRKKKKKDQQEISEAMKFDAKGFIGELSTLMSKYNVRLVHDTEGSYFEDKYGNMILDLTDKFITPEKMSKIAANTK